ncbi:MAG: hypothetical protein JXB50_06470 [Spirochaetes bacterium]|nr:hypothetical protein [Spirochaetota bacterium]
MKDLQIPLITASIFFIMIFAVNIFKNTLFVTISRSVFSGVFVFFIIFGIIYLFKFILKIDVDDTGTLTSESEDEEPSVDITLDDETGAESNIDYKNTNIITDGDENIAEIYNPEDTETYDNVSAEELSLDSENIDDIEKLDKESSEQAAKIESKNNDLNKQELKENKEEKEIKEDKGIMDTEDYNIDEIVKNPEDDDFEYYPNDDLDDAEKPLKDRLGFDVSYEDLAKAIRTEMKRDKD